MATAEPAVPPTSRVPGSMEQVTKLTRYQLREYLRGRRFVALVVLVAVIGGILTALVAYYRGGIVSTNLGFYGSLWGAGAGGEGGANLMIVLAAVFFGGDAIAGEFQNKTGYFLMGLPVRRATVYVGKFIAAFVASVAVLVIYLGVLVANGAYYFGAGAFPWQLGASFVLAVVYLGAVMGTTFVFSSLFKTSAYGFVLTAILFLFGFTVLQDVVIGLAHAQPWMVISYASTANGSVFGPSVNWGLQGIQSTTTTMVGRRSITTTVYTAGVWQGVVLMIGYLVETAAIGLWLFEREEFT
jgi:ABC-2 type transport system permease protein